MDNVQIAAVILERITMTHGTVIPMGMGGVTVYRDDLEGARVDAAFDAVCVATDQCVELGELSAADLDSGLWCPSVELDALVDVVAARVDFDA